MEVYTTAVIFFNFIFVAMRVKDVFETRADIIGKISIDSIILITSTFKVDLNPLSN